MVGDTFHFDIDADRLYGFANPYRCVFFDRRNSLPFHQRNIVIMATITKSRSAIDFLNAEKKSLSIHVSDHLNISEMYKYNSTKSGSEQITTQESVDWDEFAFELNLRIAFDYSSVHERQTYDYPGDESLEFLNISSGVEIEECSRWNDETEELEPYLLSQTERKAVAEYFQKNLNLFE